VVLLLLFLKKQQIKGPMLGFGGNINAADLVLLLNWCKIIYRANSPLLMKVDESVAAECQCFSAKSTETP
jgi:hypothetical protein